MQFHANHVSTSTFAGDYYQAMFEADKEADGPHGPYLLIQRQFEDPMTTCAMSRPTTSDEFSSLPMIGIRVPFGLRQEI